MAENNSEACSHPEHHKKMTSKLESVVIFMILVLVFICLLEIIFNTFPAYSRVKVSYVSHEEEIRKLEVTENITVRFMQDQRKEFDRYNFLVTIRGLGNGVLLGSRWILTTRYTLLRYDGDKSMDIFTNLTIYPKYNSSRANMVEEKTYKSEKIFCYPKPRLSLIEFATDVGLIKLSEDVPINGARGFKSIKLANSEDDAGEIQIAGWKKNSDKQSGKIDSSILQSVPLERVEMKKCSSIRWVPRVYHDRMICAAGKKESICDKDYGSPAIVKSKTTGEDVIVGLLSAGDKDCSQPGWIINIAEFKSWIEETMKTENSKHECQNAFPSASRTKTRWPAWPVWPRLNHLVS